MRHKRIWITDSHIQCSCLRTFCRLHDSDNLNILSVCHQFFHIFCIITFIFPDFILAVIFIIVCLIHKLKLLVQNIFIDVCSQRRRCLDLFFTCKSFDHIIQFHLISEAKCI